MSVDSRGHLQIPSPMDSQDADCSSAVSNRNPYGQSTLAEQFSGKTNCELGFCYVAWVNRAELGFGIHCPYRLGASIITALIGRIGLQRTCQIVRGRSYLTLLRTVRFALIAARRPTFLNLAQYCSPTRYRLERLVGREILEVISQWLRF